jgi:hypothetical protein
LSKDSEKVSTCSVYKDSEKVSTCSLTMDPNKQFSMSSLSKNSTFSLSKESYTVLFYVNCEICIENVEAFHFSVCILILLVYNGQEVK